MAIIDTLRVGDASPGESPASSNGTNLVAHQANVLDEAGLVARTLSEGDRRRTYLRLRPELWHRHGLTSGLTDTAHADDVARPGDLPIAVCDNAHDANLYRARPYWSSIVARSSGV